MRKKWKKLTLVDWIEFLFSGLPIIDWWYALTYTPTKLERIVFPRFVERPQREWIIATAEHFVYFVLGFLYVEYISPSWSLIVGAFALLIIVPLEFLLYRWKVKIFQTLTLGELFVVVCWNIFNAGLYWILGSFVAMAL